MTEESVNKRLIVGFETDNDKLQNITIGIVSDATMDHCTVYLLDDDSKQYILNWDDIYIIENISVYEKDKTYYGLQKTETGLSPVYYACNIIKKGSKQITIKYSMDYIDGNKKLSVSHHFYEYIVPTVIAKNNYSQQQILEIVNKLKISGNNNINMNMNMNMDKEDYNDNDDDDEIIDAVDAQIHTSGNIGPQSPNLNDEGDEKHIELPQTQKNVDETHNNSPTIQIQPPTTTYLTPLQQLFIGGHISSNYKGDHKKLFNNYDEPNLSISEFGKILHKRTALGLIMDSMLHLHPNINNMKQIGDISLESFIEIIDTAQYGGRTRRLQAYSNAINKFRLTFEYIQDTENVINNNHDTQNTNHNNNDIIDIEQVHETRETMIKRIISEKGYTVKDLQRILQYNGKSKHGQKQVLIERIINDVSIDLNVIINSLIENDENNVSHNNIEHKEEKENENKEHENEEDEEEEEEDDEDITQMTEQQKRKNREKLQNELCALKKALIEMEEIENNEREQMVATTTEIQEFYKPVTRRKRSKYANHRGYIKDRKKRIDHERISTKIITERCHQLGVQTRSILLFGHGNPDLINVSDNAEDMSRLWCSAMARNISLKLCCNLANNLKGISNSFITNQTNLMQSYNENAILEKVQKIIDKIKESGDIVLMRKAQQLKLSDLGNIISECVENDIDLNTIESAHNNDISNE